MKIYFLLKGKDKVGPMTYEELSSSISSPDELVWYEGLSNWTKYSELVEKTRTSTPPPAPEELIQVEAELPVQKEERLKAGDSSEAKKKSKKKKKKKKLKEKLAKENKSDNPPEDKKEEGFQLKPIYALWAGVAVIAYFLYQKLTSKLDAAVEKLEASEPYQDYQRKTDHFISQLEEWFYSLPEPVQWISWAILAIIIVYFFIASIKEDD